MDDAEIVDYTGENFSLGDFAVPYGPDSMLFSMRPGVSSSDQEMSMRVANLVSVTYYAYYDPICRN
jgi:hypothetical protein